MTPRPAESASTAPIPQYRLHTIPGIWAAAAVPMALLAWVVAPAVADHLPGPSPMARALLLALTAGLVWQFVLVAVLVHRECGTWRWSAVRRALWLVAPTSPRTGRSGGRVWWMLVPFAAVFALEEFLPAIPPVAGHDLPAFLDSPDGTALLGGNWGWFAVIVALAVFNTVLGEELLFRGLLLPRMNGVFGRFDWVANGVLFGAYHLHMPWAIPTAMLDTIALAYPSRRYQSAWMGIIIHSAQSVVIVVATVAVVLR